MPKGVYPRTERHREMLKQNASRTHEDFTSEIILLRRALHRYINEFGPIPGVSIDKGKLKLSLEFDAI